MGVSKVEYNNETLIDVSNDTVTPSTLAKGYTAHNSNGDPIVGTMSSEGGSGSGIIDVTELPTSGIDENAVYRLTENIQTEKNEIYFNSGGGIFTLQQYLTSLGAPTIPNLYAVDELPSDMKVTDVQTFSEVHCYILKSNGVAYFYAPVYGGVITCGLMAFQSTEYDKGFTENIYNEFAGVYTTLEAIKEVVRYFIRDNSEWKEVTAYINTLTCHGFADTNMLSGDITTRVLAVNDVVTAECTEISESWFRKRDGSYHDLIRPYLFSKSPFINVTIPSCIKWVEHNAFYNCGNLTTITFKSTPISNGVSEDAFYQCLNLTTINVPWAEGRVSNAPWGATNATINYNYTEG